MPHGGYHGTIAVNPGTTLAVNPGSALNIGGGQQIVGGQSVLTNQGVQNVGGSAPSTTENIEKQIEDQVNEIKKKRQLGVLNEDARSAFLANQTGIANLSNLLRQQQEQNLANQVKSLFAKAGSDKETADNLRKLFTGDLGDKTFFGINLGSTETTDSDKTSGLGAATVINPFTGERITTGKIREGMTSPEYAQYMSELYNLNPALMEEMFPLASGNLAQPIISRLLEGGFGKVGQGIGSFVDSATGAIFKPRGGTVRPSDVGTPSDTGGVTSVMDAPKANNNPFNIPSAFTGFYESDFYNPNAAGGQAITPVTLPDGTVVRFPNTAIGGQFRQYLESLGINQPPATGVDVVKSQPTGISKFDVDKFYASLPQYTQQGIMAPTNLSRFTDALRMFPGATV
mgnify:CR=1 FL=1